MGAIQIKGIHPLQVKFSGIEFEPQFAELEMKLSLLKPQHGHPVEVFFDQPAPLPEAVIQRLFLILQQQQCVCTAIYYPEWELEKIHLLTKPLRCWQPVQVTGHTVYPFDLKADQRLEVVSGSLIVMGTIAGQVVCHDPHAMIIAAGLHDARIKIFDSIFQNMTKNAKVCVYYEYQKCVARSIKEEDVWQGLSWSPAEKVE